MTIGSLNDGLSLDDFVHRAMASGHPLLPASPLDMFHAADGDAALNKAKMDLGVYPWFTHPDLRVAFFRPLASLSAWIDYRLWPTRPALMHLQNIAWYVALCGVTSVLFNRWIRPAWAAVIGSVLFAMDEAHGIAVGWVAARNQLMAATFGVIALLVHDRWRRDEWAKGAWLAPVCLAASLASGEMGIGALGYLIAHVAVFERGGGRIVAIAPHIAVAGAWAVMNRLLGCGVAGGSYYLDPIANPFAFAGAVFERLPQLMLMQLGFPQSTLAALSISPVGPLLGYGPWVAGVLLIPLMVVAVQKGTPRMLAIGMILSAIPLCATAPQARLLLFPSLGAMGLMALLSGRVCEAARGTAARIWRVAALPLVGLSALAHGLLAPVDMMRTQHVMAGLQQAEARARRSLLASGDLANKTLVVVGATNALTISQWFFAASEPSNAPRRLRCLHTDLEPAAMQRIDAHTIVLRPRRAFGADPLGALFRGSFHPMRVGDEIQLDGVTAEVTALAVDGRAGEARFRFSVPLEDPSLVWVALQRGEYRVIRPPSIGQSVNYFAECIDMEPTSIVPALGWSPPG